MMEREGLGSSVSPIDVYLLEQDKLYVGSASIIPIASATAYSNNLLVSSIEERDLMICIVTSPLIPSKSLT